MPQSIFNADTAQLERLIRALPDGATQALDAAWKVLQVWGEKYKTMVERVTPVDTGRARQSWFVVAERSSGKMTITLANAIKGQNGHMPYVYYLEFGTDRIAGGRVKDWQTGDAPIVSWPAKSADLPVMPRFGTRAYERYEDVLTHAFTAGEGEQMPMLRPIGHQIAPLVAEDVAQALLEGFSAVVTKRRGRAA